MTSHLDPNVMSRVAVRGLGAELLPLSLSCQGPNEQAGGHGQAPRGPPRQPEQRVASAWNDSDLL